MGRLRGVLMLAAALLAGTAAAFGARAWLQARVADEVRKTTEAGPAPGAPVVTVSHDVQRATRLTAEDLVLARMPEGSAMQGALHSLDQAAGRQTRARLYAGEPLLEAKLDPPGAPPGIESSIPDGLRAMTVKADDVIGLAGFALPGSRVDVVAVLKAARADDPSARLILQDVEVLASDQGVDPGDGKPRQATSITLLVRPGEAERLALAVAQGRIQLTLRSPADRGTTVTGGIDAPTLLSTPQVKAVVRRESKREPKKEPPKPDPEVDLAATTHNVELIENDHRQKVALKREEKAAARTPSRHRRTP